MGTPCAYDPPAWVRPGAALRRWPGAIMVASAALAAAAAADPERALAARPPLPVEAFASLPDLQTAALSPSGKWLAFIAHRDGVAYVLMRALPDGKPAAVLRNDNERAVINWIRWASDDVLLASVRFPGLRSGVRTVETRLFGVAAGGGSARPLPGVRRGSYVPQIQDRIVDLLPEDPDHILMALDVERPGRPGIHRVNVHSGKRRRVHRGRADYVDWLTDAGHRVRVGVELDGKRYRVHERQPGSGRWRELWAYQAYSAESVHPLGFGQNPNELYVTAYHEGFLALFRVDLGSRSLDRELVISQPGRDVDGRLLYSPRSSDVIGMVFANGTVALWDSSYEAFYRGLEHVFPGQRVSLLGMSDDEQRYLAFATGNRQPGVFYLGDRSAGTLSPVGSRYQQLPPEVLSGKRPVSYRARDGTRIEAFLTLPSGSPGTDLPAVIFPHGGPIARDSMSFDYWTEFFASRGYAVLQMNYRGSSGYGLEFLQAGLGSWGGVMQDDVVDGTRWLISQGIADPARLCIVGGSYGGYAALMGVAAEPELYRCAVSFAGVTDLRAMRAYGRNFVSRQVLETQLGRHDFDARSPVKLAHQIAAAVLLVHGSDDRVVPVAQSRVMRDALARAGARYVYVEQDGGDHFLSEQPHRLQLFRRMEAFLAEHLGPGTGWPVKKPRELPHAAEKPPPAP